MPIATHAATSAEVERPENNAALRQEMRATLLALPYRAFLQVVLHLLQTQGYSSVRPAGRSHWKGRNQSGGWDAEAEVSVKAFDTLRCLVQAKQFDTLPVHQRSVDELRGSGLRAGAQQALLLTLSTFSPVARKAAETKTALPVRLLDGETLLTLLLENYLGIIKITNNKITNDIKMRTGAWQLNAFYFQLLRDKFSEGNHRRHTSNPRSASEAVQLKPTPAQASMKRAGVNAFRRQGKLTVTVTVDAPEGGSVQTITARP